MKNKILNTIYQIGTEINRPRLEREVKKKLYAKGVSRSQMYKWLNNAAQPGLKSFVQIYVELKVFKPTLEMTDLIDLESVTKPLQN